MDCLDVVLYQEIQARLTSLPSQPTPFGPTSISQQRYTHTHTHTPHHSFPLSSSLSPFSSSSRSCHDNAGEKRVPLCGPAVVVATRWPEVIRTRPWDKGTQTSSTMATGLQFTSSYIEYLFSALSRDRRMEQLRRIPK